jgi:hypothetical protein
MFSASDFQKIINIPLVVIIASFLIIIITTNMLDKNGLSALIGGYFGLLVGLLFVIILHVMFTGVRIFDFVPIAAIMGIIILIIFYLIKFFDKIARGHVASSYSTFSFLSVIFMFFQIIVIIQSVMSQKNLNASYVRLFSDKTISILMLFGLINLLIAITIGVILQFYTTQG